MQDMSKTIEKKLKRKSVSGGQAKLLNIPRNWLHQGLFYMDRTEFYARLFVEVIGIVFLSIMISYIVSGVVAYFLLGKIINRTETEGSPAGR